MNYCKEEAGRLISKLEESISNLRDYCETENFMGWDPYDGLNSPIIKKTFLHRVPLARLIFIQFFKRSPINLRKIFFIPKQHNPKGIALLISGYCNLYHIKKEKDQNESLLIKEKIIYLSDLLLSLKSRGYSGDCWGYNFDWQARFYFLFKAYTPTVVATSFCVDALLSAYKITQKEDYLKSALSSRFFILNDLKKENFEDGFLLSYAPVDGNNTVYNASLLGAKALSKCYEITGEKDLINAAKQIVNCVCKNQNRDGSWVYGRLSTQTWIDSYHTGYNLQSIYVYQKISGDLSFKRYLKKGLDFYIKNFFEDNGLPKHFHDNAYPIDIHCPGQLFMTLCEMEKIEENKVLVQKVLEWTVRNMQDRKGFFYFQLKKVLSSKISYMRWNNAFMFKALTDLLRFNHEQY